MVYLLPVQRQVGHSGQQPTVSQLALLHVKTAETLDEELRVISNLLQWTKYINGGIL